MSADHLLPRRVAGVLCALEGLTILGFLLFFGYELVIGGGDDAARVLMSMVLMALAAAALLAMARGWWRGQSWPRTPTILWNLLLLPVAWSMYGAGFWGAWPLGLAAVGAIACAFATGSRSSRQN